MLPGMEWNGKLYTNNLPASSTCCIRKWFTPENTANEYDGSLDFYVIRYAEVLLSLSEAMIEKGGYSQAEITKYINEVRDRVGMPAVEEVEGTNLEQDELRALYAMSAVWNWPSKIYALPTFIAGKILRMLRDVCRKTSHSMASE